MTLRRDAGWTAVELLTVVVIIAALVLLAMPTLRGLRDRSVLTGATATVAGAFERARWEAAENGAARVADVSAPGIVAVETADGDPLWTATYPSPGVTLTAPLAEITYDSRGFVTPSATIAVTLTSAGGRVETLTITPFGRVR